MLDRRVRSRPTLLRWPWITATGVAFILTYLYLFSSDHDYSPSGLKDTVSDLIIWSSDGGRTKGGKTRNWPRCLLSDGSWTEIANPDYIPSPNSGPLEAAPPNDTLRIISCHDHKAAHLLPTATLPPSHQFWRDNGTRWTLEYVGNITFTGDIAEKNVVGDKCRSSRLGDKVIWNCGDMWCDFDYTICGFAMGPAMYGTDDVMTINTTGITRIYDNDFVKAWEGDAPPEEPYKFWGMDTSNVAAINETHGVAYGFEVWRGGGPDDIRRGNCVAWVTLAPDMPIATRVGPLLTGPDEVEMGMLAILRAGDYIYIYSEGGPSRLLVTRVRANEDVLDISKYETLEFNTTNHWTSEIPQKSTEKYGMTTKSAGGEFGCAVYGSVFYSNYFEKYVILCNIYEDATNMFVSDTPYGPWSEEYGLLRGRYGYGSMAHPHYSPGGSHKELYFSLGPNAQFMMFKLTFKYH